MKNGWILIHRKLKNKAWAKDPDYLALWVHLLLSASWEDTQFMMNRQIVNLKRGEFVAGRKSLSVNSGIGESKVYRILEFFKSEQQINIKPTNKYSIISITNYDQYQVTGQQSEQQVNSRRTAGEQQANTIKEVKQLKEVIKIPEGIELSAWQDYEKYRSSLPKQKRMTDKARELAIKKLLDYPPEIQRKMVDESIFNGWTGLFPLKGNSNGTIVEQSKPGAFERRKQKLQEWDSSQTKPYIDGELVGQDD